MNATEDQNHGDHGAGEGLDGSISQDVARARVTVGPGDEKMSCSFTSLVTDVSSAIWKGDMDKPRRLQHQHLPLTQVG